MDFTLNENEKMVRDLAREFADKVLRPQMEEIDKKDQLSDELFRQMTEMGFLGIVMPEEYGGLGLGYENFVLAVEEIAKVSGGVASALLVSLTPLEAISVFGTGEQKEKYIPPALRGEYRAAMAFTEPETGSDPKQLTTKAQRQGDYYILNGTKRFISNASYPGPILLYARDADTGLCTAFIFDKFCEGYSISTAWEKIGLFGSPVHDIFLDNVKVPADCVLGKEGQGFDILLEASAYGKLGFIAAFLGTMCASYEAALKYAKEKMHRGKPIGKFQAIQLKIGLLASKYESARWMAYRVGSMANHVENMEEFKAQAALVKGYIADLSVECGVLAMNVLGSYGVMREYQVERMLRDSLIAPHIEGVSDIQRIIAANYLLRH